jgi:hypothetical protein
MADGNGECVREVLPDVNPCLSIAIGVAGNSRVDGICEFRICKRFVHYAECHLALTCRCQEMVESAIRDGESSLCLFASLETFFLLNIMSTSCDKSRY